ncbi:hypothetical protein V1281_003329 [Nitrobacteraceae bacterium AZCC 2161]
MNLFVGGELAPVSLRKGVVEGGGFLGAQFKRRLIDAGELQQQPCKRILRFGGQVAHGLNGLFKQNSHAGKIAVSRPFRKPPDVWHAGPTTISRTMGIASLNPSYPPIFTKSKTPA